MWSTHDTVVCVSSARPCVVPCYSRYVPGNDVDGVDAGWKDGYGTNGYMPATKVRHTDRTGRRCWTVAPTHVQRAERVGQLPRRVCVRVPDRSHPTIGVGREGGWEVFDLLVFWSLSSFSPCLPPTTFVLIAARPHAFPAFLPFTVR